MDSSQLIPVVRKGGKIGRKNRQFGRHFELLSSGYFFCTTSGNISDFLNFLRIWDLDKWEFTRLLNEFELLECFSDKAISPAKSQAMYQLINRNVQATPRFSNSCQGWLISGCSKITWERKPFSPPGDLLWEKTLDRNWTTQFSNDLIIIRKTVKWGCREEEGGTEGLNHAHHFNLANRCKHISDPQHSRFSQRTAGGEE